MSQQNVSERVNQLIQPIVSDLGYEIVEIEYKKVQSDMNLTIFIDFPQGENKSIAIEDCEVVSRAIDEPLDNLDPTNGQPYNLMVSSPGLDRPLKTDKDLSRNIGCMVEISLYAKLNGKKHFVGELIAFDDEVIEINISDKLVKLEKKSISNITKHISF